MQANEASTDPSVGGAASQTSAACVPDTAFGFGYTTASRSSLRESQRAD
jgi:hypothetical protein